MSDVLVKPKAWLVLIAFICLAIIFTNQYSHGSKHPDYDKAIKCFTDQGPDWVLTYLQVGDNGIERWYTQFCYSPKLGQLFLRVVRQVAKNKFSEITAYPWTNTPINSIQDALQVVKTLYNTYWQLDKAAKFSYIKPGLENLSILLFKYFDPNLNLEEKDITKPETETENISTLTPTLTPYAYP